MYIDVVWLPLKFLHTSCIVKLCNLSDTFIVGPTVQCIGQNKHHSSSLYYDGCTMQYDRMKLFKNYS